MPELPEVETVVVDLRPVITGLRFEELDSSFWRAVEAKVDFSELKGKKVEKVWRRGKFIVIDFEGGLVMTMHLRMSGRVLIRERGDEEMKFERHRIEFSDGVSLRFCDQRKFGKIWLSRKESFEDDTGIFRLGIEPFDEGFSAEKFLELLAKKKGPIKKYLLDQSLVAGVGNIYADEACFYAGVRPDAKVEDLSSEQLEKLYQSVLKALNQGIRNRGTSVSDYEDAYGKTGRNQEQIFVYGRKGEPCLECGTDLTGIRLVGRGTVYCEKCQTLTAD